MALPESIKKRRIGPDSAGCYPPIRELPIHPPWLNTRISHSTDQIDRQWPEIDSGSQGIRGHTILTHISRFYQSNCSILQINPSSPINQIHCKGQEKMTWMQMRYQRWGRLISHGVIVIESFSNELLSSARLLSASIIIEFLFHLRKLLRRFWLLLHSSFLLLKKRKKSKKGKNFRSS